MAFNLLGQSTVDTLVARASDNNIGAFSKSKLECQREGNGTRRMLNPHPALSPARTALEGEEKVRGELNRNRLAFFEDAEGGEMQLVEFAHDFFLVDRLEMIGVDRDIRATELAEFLCKQGGREVLADSGQFVLAIRIGTFDERRLEVRSLSGH